MTKVFAYGTLRRGEQLHRQMIVAGGVYLGDDTVTGVKKVQPEKLFYPFAAIGNEDDKISGEVFEVEDQGLSILDEVEGYPILFTRQVMETDKGEEVVVYFGGKELQKRYL